MPSIKPKDGAEHWKPSEPRPPNINVAAWQKRIDQITGTRDGRSLIKLAWAPEELRWRPHAHGTAPLGYTFPIFVAYHDKDGNEVAAPRWVLLERIEPEQFAPTWEATRYSMYGGRFGTGVARYLLKDTSNSEQFAVTMGPAVRA